jgi:hypothetical protein
LRDWTLGGTCRSRTDTVPDSRLHPIDEAGRLVQEDAPAEPTAALPGLLS